MYRVNTIRLIALALLSLPSVGRPGDLALEKYLIKDNRLAAYLKGGDDDDDDDGGRGRGRGRGRGGDDGTEDDNSGSSDDSDDDSNDDNGGGDDDTSDDNNDAGTGVNTNNDTGAGDFDEARAQIDRIIIGNPGITIYYKNGWVEFLDPDIYELRDYKNRRVVRRKATRNDVWRFDQLLGQ